MSLESVNLNLLPVLRALLKHRSVTLAAEAMGISQSAASQALGRLRTQLQDPLLQRIGGRMQLTPLAKTLALRVETISAELADLFLPSKFDPRSAERNFVIAANDYTLYLLGRTLLNLQRTLAPGIRMHFIDIHSNLAEQMVSQEIDFALLPRFVMDELSVTPLRYRKLRSDLPGVLMDRAHPLTAQKTISEAELARYEHVMYHAEPLGLAPSKNWRAPPEVAPLWKVIRKVAIRTNHFTLVPTLIQDSDLVAMMPFDVGLELSKVWPTEVRRLSFGPAAIETGLAWSPVFDADPAHLWFRTQMETYLTQAAHASKSPH